MVLDIYDCFGGQFLALEASIDPAATGKASNDIESLDGLAAGFADGFHELVASNQRVLDSLDGPAVVWGAGSKGTTFLNLLERTDRIAGIVDINPNKHGKFVPCTGHEILAPEQLREIAPKHVFIMNPLYTREIEASLSELGVDARTYAVQ